MLNNLYFFFFSYLISYLFYSFHVAELALLCSYCECFAAGEYCDGLCSCKECFNRFDYEDTVLESREQIESRYPLAFAPKIVQCAAESSQNIGVRTP